MDCSVTVGYILNRPVFAVQGGYFFMVNAMKNANNTIKAMYSICDTSLHK